LEAILIDVFVSHAAKDQRLAEFLYQHLTQEGLKVFLASVSIPPGSLWQAHIMNSLRESTWVLCLASRAACASPWVMQEMGAAILSNKKLVPVIWDQPSESLPGWMQQYQVVNLAGLDSREAIAAFGEIAETIKAEKQKGTLIAAFILTGLLLFAK
jgi:hypothetical protein